MSHYTHKVTRKGELCSEHRSEANARKAVARLVSMSKGKLTVRDFRVELIVSGVRNRGIDREQVHGTHVTSG